MDSYSISNILSIISLTFYSIVYFPQFMVIYKNKSTEGFSLTMLFLWTQADILSLDSIILLYLPINLIILAWYHASIGLILIMFTLYYKDNKTDFDILVSIAYIVINVTVAIFLNTYVTVPYSTIGSIIGYITTAIYVLGRLPQIILNHYRNSTEGLSILMYIFTILGNFFYILTITIIPEYIIPNLPWIISGVFTILLDIYVIIQHQVYKKREKNCEMFSVHL